MKMPCKRQAIDESVWKPSAATRLLRKPLRLGGAYLTDIDAVGERNGELLLVSCKWIAYTPQYDAGVYSVVRNASTTVVSAIDTLERLLGDRIGDNYDLTSYKAIHTVVCTPHPLWVPIGQATAQPSKGLYRACSIAELRRWLGSPAKSSRRLTRPRRRRKKRR